MTTHKKGFTLVELSIVLVIIGLLIGGVLKGQSMIENAKVKRFASDVDGLVAATYSYQDKFNALPGDDARGLTDTHGSLANGNGDGLFNSNAEDADVYRSLITEQFLSGSIAKITNQNSGTQTPFGSNYVFRSGVTRDATFTGNHIRTSAVTVPDSIAHSLDIKFDDGVANTGAFQTTAGAYGDNTNKTIAWYKF